MLRWYTNTSTNYEKKITRNVIYSIAFRALVMDQQYLNKGGQLWVTVLKKKKEKKRSNCPSIATLHNNFTFGNNISPMTTQIKKKRKKKSNDN